METKILCEKTPLMYKGFLIKRDYSKHYRLCAYNLSTGVFIEPLYKTWYDLKAIIDAMK